MTYKKFSELGLSEQVGRYWVLTIIRKPEDEARVIVAQFERSNHKWYTPEPYEGRKEVGYTNEIWLDEDNRNWLIYSIR